MKKKLISTLLTVATVVSMTACGVSAPETPAAQPAADAQASDAAPADAAAEPAKDAITLVMAEVNPLDSISGMTDAKFKEEVEKRSNGSIIIDLQANQVLGAEQDVLDTMLGGGGTIDLARISAFSLTSYGGESSMLLSLPYTFVSRDHFWNFAQSDLAKDFLEEPQKNGAGVRGLFYGEEGFRHFFTVIMNGLVEGLGASPTVVAFGELYSALQTGVVDAAEQPIANYKSNAFPEVANNIILDGHTLGAIEVIITDSAWDKMTPAQQEAMMEAGKLAGEYCKEISADKEAEVLQQLKDEGCNVIEVTDIKPWQDAVAKVIDEQVNTDELKDLYQKILDLQ